MKRRLAAALWLTAIPAPPAFAHSAERGFVLLLPTTHIIVAGAMAVAVSIAVLLAANDSTFRKIFACEIPLFRLPLPPVPWVSLTSALGLAGLVWVGYHGTRDPLENLLTLTVWVAWWVVIVLLHPLVGNLWGWLSPFAFVKAPPRLAIPAYVPAVVIFAAFAWFQLVSARPEDPAVLALAVAVYLASGFAGVLTFGTEAWHRKGDPFAVFMGQLAAAAPLARRSDGRIGLRVPGGGLARLAALPAAGVMFVLLTLSTVSFDGFANTFTWLSWGGINPLDFPGRSAVATHNSLGLAGAFVVLAVLYWSSVALGWWLAGRPVPLAVALGRFVFSLIPISIAFHFAHYLTDLLVNGQYLLVALGVMHSHPTASFLNTSSGALAIYSIQTIAIVAGHVMGVAAGHLIALDLSPLRSGRLELPLAVLMVAYTAFGLWTLSAPAIG